MMNSKIKELTENIYKEGIEKAKNEGEQIIADARNEAEKIIAEASEKAAATLESAKTDTAKLYDSLKNELEEASGMLIELTKQKVVNLITGELSSDYSDKITNDSEALKTMILEVTRAWSNDGYQQQHLEVLVPEKMMEILEPLFKSSAEKVLKSGLVVKPVADLEKGFQIVNSSEGFKISFTDEDFNTFFTSLIKPKIKEFLFNSKSK